VPSLGYAVVDWVEPQSIPAGLVATQSVLENELLRACFGQDGTMVSLYDKEHERDVVPVGEEANVLMLYQDDGDAWDIPLDYAARPCRQATLLESKAFVDGPRAVLHQSFQAGSSRLDQQIILTAGSRRLDFVTTVDWQESSTMLRTRFPLTVRASTATYDIQFGSFTRPTHRNTSWDQARFEVCGQKWVDISEAGYGVALLNDCKYGHAVEPNAISLNLLRSPSYPDPTADRAKHEFTYALYPHAGGPGDGGVGRAGYELNMPLLASPITPHHGTGPAAASFAQVDAVNVVVETVKQAETGDAIVLRLYEAQGKATRTHVHFAFPVETLQEVDLMEENARDIAAGDTDAILTFAPFEIRTLRLTIN
jgi:alpha-mannosidase